MATWHFCLCSRVCWGPPATARSRQTGLPASLDPLQMAHLEAPELRAPPIRSATAGPLSFLGARDPRQRSAELDSEMRITRSVGDYPSEWRSLHLAPASAGGRLRAGRCRNGER